jgi:hypothetical protein
MLDGHALHHFFHNPGLVQEFQKHASKSTPPPEANFRAIREFIAFPDFRNWTSDPKTEELIAGGKGVSRRLMHVVQYLTI